MNTDTGEIVTGAAEIAKRIAAGEPVKEMLISPKDYQMRRRPPSVGVNDPCPCGSGKKFKKCCYTGR